MDSYCNKLERRKLIILLSLFTWNKILICIFTLNVGEFKVRRDSMDHEFLSVEEFNVLLRQWSGRTIKITKHELDDVDQTVLNLQNISYDQNLRRIDDYVPKHSLLLHGDGQIETLTTMSNVSLPSSNYEIPLQDDSLYEFNGETFVLTTNRGVYKIELA